MKLFYSATSPYVRKVMACAITRGMDARIQLVPTESAGVSEAVPELALAEPK